MSRNYLLEIGLEEVPARFLVALKDQLQDRVQIFLQEQRLAYESIQAFATPRRLAVLVHGLAEVQEDASEVAKGPAMTIAQDEEGNWTKAALGFMKGQGVDPSAAYVDNIKDVPYLFVKKFQKGQAAAEVLQNMDKVIKEMTFPVTMHWHDYKVPFIRPVHWLVSLLDQEIVPINFVGIQADRVSRGHRFLGQDVLIQTATDYLAALKAQYVVVDFDERKSLIQAQLEALGQEKGWQIPIDQDLLEEVTAIVEWPTVFYGEFDQSYLDLPEIVLITAMKDHQRYFYAKDMEGKLLPVFISVRNGNQDHIENVVKGNRKVLRARLEDALFFYQEDLKKPLNFYIEKLDHVNEHFKLGSLGQKQDRVYRYIETIAPYLNIGGQAKDDAQAAAKVYKFDLMTQTVGEFDELQGEIGAIYGKHYGLSDQVCQVIGDQYLPKTAGGELPKSQAAILLTIADKIDTLVNYFAVDLVPTGSNDPYALRRQAMGLVEILDSTDIEVDLAHLIGLHPVLQDQNSLLETILQFIKARLVNSLEKLEVDFDIIKAIEGAGRFDINQNMDTAFKLAKIKLDQPNQYRDMVEALTRVVNLGAKVQDPGQVDQTLSQSESEAVLMRMVAAGPGQDIFTYFDQLVGPINTYFEENMVNDQDTSIRQNRLSLMFLLTSQIVNYFDPRQLLSKF
ncbi:TPA: glycine--tRNA ligase subunit beta [Streptococcus suis]